MVDAILGAWDRHLACWACLRENTGPTSPSINTALPLRTNSCTCQIIANSICAMLKGCAVVIPSDVQGQNVVRAYRQLQANIRRLHTSSSSMALPRQAFGQALSVPQKYGEFQRHTDYCMTLCCLKR